MSRLAAISVFGYFFILAAAPDLFAQTGLEIGDYTETRIFSPDPANRDRFGSPLAMDGDWLLVGATGDDEAALNAGAVYIYLRQAGSWTLHRKLMADDAQSGDGFGSDVDISGNWMVVGAAGVDLSQQTDSGAAYTYKWDGDSWEPNQKLTAFEAGDGGDDFGFSVGIDGSIPGEDPDAGPIYTLVIGAPGEEGPTTSVDAGAVYLYQLNSQDGWEPKGYFAPELPDAMPLDRFGFSVDIAGDGIIVGTPNDVIEGTAIDPGAAYFMQRRNLGGVWGFEWKFRRDGQMTGSEQFGFSVAIDFMSGTGFVVIGAPQQAGVIGETYLYTGITNLWTETILSLADTTNVGRYGGAVAIDLPLIVSGAPLSDFGNINTGAVFLFEPVFTSLSAPQGVVWTEIGKLVGSDATQFTQMAESVAVHRFSVAAGAPLDDTAGINQGKLYMYDILPFFADGFESGDALAWSQVVP